MVDILTIDPTKRSGQPTIRGMRITVYDVLKMLATGMSADAIVADFPELTKDDIAACLTFASERERTSARSFIYVPTSRPKFIA